MTSNHASTEKSSEPSGIEVACNLNHVEAYEVRLAFKSFIKDFYYFFPNIECNIDFKEYIKEDFTPPIVGVANEELGFARVVQRGITYRVQWEGAPNVTVYVADNAILDIHPSREFLEGTERNKSVFNVIVEKEINRQDQEIMKDFPREGNDFEKWKFTEDRISEVNYLKLLGHDLDTGLKRRNIDLKTYGIAHGFHSMSDCLVHKYSHKGESNTWNQNPFNVNCQREILFCRQKTLSERRRDVIKSYCEENQLNPNVVLVGVENPAGLKTYVEERLEGLSALLHDVSELKLPPLPKGHRSGPTYIVANKDRNCRLSLSDGKTCFYYARGEEKHDTNDLYGFKNYTGASVYSIAPSNVRLVPENWIEVSTAIRALKRKGKKEKHTIVEESIVNNLGHGGASLVWERFPRKKINPFSSKKKSNEAKKFVDFLSTLVDSVDEDTRVAWALFDRDSYAIPSVAKEWAKQKINNKIKEYETN